MNRVLCQFHDEDTPSMIIYPDGVYHCFGCGAHGKTTELGLTNIPVPKPKIIENLKQTLDYVEKLPIKEYRGLLLPCNSDYAYLVWPNKSYYVKRTLDNSEPKYKCPSGHTKPLLIYESFTHKQTLFIIEGQINALSMATVTPYSVVSPGGANDLYDKKHFTYYLNYLNIIIIADNDAAGAWGAIQLKSELLKLNHRLVVKIKLLDEDANDILTKYGKEKLKEEIDNWQALEV